MVSWDGSTFRMKMLTTTVVSVWYLRVERGAERGERPGTRSEWCSGSVEREGKQERVPLVADLGWCTRGWSGHLVELSWFGGSDGWDEDERAPMGCSGCVGPGSANARSADRETSAPEPLRARPPTTTFRPTTRARQ